MFDLIVRKDLIELIGKNISFPDVDSIGKYIFNKYNTHTLENVSESITISALNAAKRLVEECESKNKINELLCFIIELDGTLLNGKRVEIEGLEHLLYRLTNMGFYFDYNKRKLISYNNEKKILKNWGALKEGKEYSITVASIDICDNSKLVCKYKSSVIEEIYYHLWEYIRKKCDLFDGRIWSRAGDGSIIAFRNDKGLGSGVSCCMDILFSLPVFNSLPVKNIPDEINMRIGLDSGMIRFYDDTGRIVSDVINYASRLEKNATSTNGFSVTDDIYRELSPAMQKMFKNKSVFEGKKAYSFNFAYDKALS